LASQAEGRTILDIGCSEGILCVLLARDGFDVTGVDINLGAIDYARQLLAAEPPLIQKRIRLLHSDIASAKLSTGSFQTVFLGEVIEHVLRPRAIVARAVELLADGGRLVLTTPLGVHPHPDHRHSFGLKDVAELLQSSCKPDIFEA